MKTTSLFLFLCSCLPMVMTAQQPVPERPRILISSDIGGTDPDDNQSMAHLLMYNERFDIEGLVSSPSFGDGNKAEILRMIDLYAQDYAKLSAHVSGLLSPDSLRTLCKQGRHGAAPYAGYATPTEGSEWIVKCARRESSRPLWILVWGGLEDVAQALHDAPDILPRIRVYWIGGPNKKWSVNSYAYVAEHCKKLWMIENNASYRGFIGNSKKQDAYNVGYYDLHMKGAGALGSDFIAYYAGNVKMGDSPSLFYMMDGDPADRSRESWGGRFEPMRRSPKRIFRTAVTEHDSVPVYSVVEFQFKGSRLSIAPDSVCFTLTIDRQAWPGYYLGRGRYAVRYAPKAAARLPYTVKSDLPGFEAQEGVLVVYNRWPGESNDGFSLGYDWYTDVADPALFEKGWQGSGTTSRWRNAILDDWADRWSWLK